MLAIKTTVEQSSLYKRSTTLLGTNFEISVVADNPAFADARISEAINEINRVERLLSVFTEGNCINNINRNAGVQAVKVQPEVFGLIDRAVQISALTYGAFDITYAADNAAKQQVNYKDVVLDSNKQTVMLKHDGMRISFAANIKGYAADRARRILQMNGVSSGVINAAGDLLTWGLQPNNRPWTIGTADESLADQPYGDVNISNMAMATTVNASSAAAINHKLADCIDAKKGFKVSAVKSVSVLSPTAEFSDALTSPLMSIGVNASLYLINQLNQVACIIVDDKERIYTSKDINVR